MEQKEIGKKLRIERKKRDLTMQQLSILSGVAKTTIQSYENGKINIPSDKIVLCSKIFEKDPNYFLLDEKTLKSNRQKSNEYSDISFALKLCKTTLQQFKFLSDDKLVELIEIMDDFIITNKSK